MLVVAGAVQSFHGLQIPSCPLGLCGGKSAWIPVLSSTTSSTCRVVRTCTLKTTSLFPGASPIVYRECVCWFGEGYS
uniref:Uncharacterized protein n=1 Tax=Anguilla anguilla TaxID=7936 RepID=A0A0E9WTE2_ANGAN